MSYFVFGSFDSPNNESLFDKIKKYGQNKGVYFWFNSEITFYPEIFKMCKEQASQKQVTFALTSSKQPSNSSDLLFPYDKFTNQELFSNGSRLFFNRCCESNIRPLFDCLKKLLALFKLKNLEIFTVEGYDTGFIKKKCTLEEMELDLLTQIKTTSIIESCIYSIIKVHFAPAYSLDKPC